jgi:hypothetical protein
MIDLMDMDVVIYSFRDSHRRPSFSSLTKGNDVTPESESDNPLMIATDSIFWLGAVQEDGTVAPLSIWSRTPAFDTYLECVVDEHDRFPGLIDKDILVHALLPSNVVSYGSRQVGGGKGPGNPHGEESELIYYVQQEALEQVQIVVKPELEILW